MFSLQLQLQLLTLSDSEVAAKTSDVDDHFMSTCHYEERSNDSSNTADGTE